MMAAYPLSMVDSLILPEIAWSLTGSKRDTRGADRDRQTYSDACEPDEFYSVMTNAGSVTSQNLNPMHGMTICSSWSAFTSAGAVGRHTGGLMTFGGSIFLIAVGLVLALAVNVSVSGIDLQLVGWILAGVGVLGLMVSLAFYWRRRSVVVEPPPVAPDDYPPRY
jgi:Domain of unknown function (DUF6458)